MLGEHGGFAHFSAFLITDLRYGGNAEAAMHLALV